MQKTEHAEGQQHKPPLEVLNEKQASRYINMSLAFLRRRRSEGNREGITPGPRFLKIGKSVRYMRADLDVWLEKHLKEVS